VRLDTLEDMTQQPERPDSSDADDPRVIVIGPGGMAVSGASGPDGQGDAGQEDGEQRHVTDLVEQPAKVMRIGGMIRQLLDEVKAAPLDEASRTRLAGIYESSIAELKSGLAPELVEELERLSLPFGSEAPSEAELRIAQAQLVGWLEGLFHGIQTAIYAQQMAARAQLEQMRRALPPGVGPGQGMPPGQGHPAPVEGDPRSGGLYL
jgi:proteasome activator-like protein